MPGHDQRRGVKMSNQTGLALQGNELSAQALDNMSWGIQRQTTREIEQVNKRAIVANVHEEARAQLCQTAMMNAGVISTLEENLIQLSPLGSERYRAIADAFVIGTCK